jgi:hypothetical protein
MPLTAQNILDRSSMIIQDLTNVRWPQSEILNWLNDARRELAVVRPDIYSTSQTLTLAAGAKQALPSNGLRLMDVPRNTNGAAITITNRGFLDQQQPSWHQQTAVGGVIRHFMLDERDQRTFWVYPPALSSSSVEIIYQQAPTDYTVASVLTAFEELYGGAMVDYICYRAFSKDSEYAGNANRALAHYQQFINALNGGRQTDFAYNANQNNVGGAKNRPMGGGVGNINPSQGN